MWDYLERLFGRGFMPHGHCYLWSPAMVTTQVASNLSIGIAYVAISFTLATILRRVGKVPFSWAYVAFGVFILACGLTHLLDVVTVWHPVYWLDAAVRVVTAFASVGTAVLLVPLVPKAVALAGAERLAARRGVELEEALAKLRELATAQHRITQTITDNASVALFVIDARQRCTFVNPAAETLTGLSLNRITEADEPLHDLVHGRRGEGGPCPGDGCPLARALAGGLRERGEATFVREDGQTYSVAFTASPLVEEGKTIGTVLEARDTSVEKRHEAWLEAVIDRSPIGITVFDKDLRFVRVNAAVAAMNALPPEAHLGRTFREVLPVTAAHVEHEYRRVLETGEAAPALDASITVAGQEWHFRLSIYPVVLQGFVTGVVGMVQDTTRQTQDRQRLELLARTSRSLEQLDADNTVREVPNLFVPTLADWACVLLTTDRGPMTVAACRHADPEREGGVREALEVMAATPDGISRLLHAGREPTFIAQVDETFLRALAHGDEGWLAGVRRLGMRSFAAVFLAGHNGPLGLLVLGTSAPGRSLRAEDLPIVEEIGRRAAAALENARLFQLAQVERRRAEEANRAKDEFLAVVSHELRTPLNAILGWSAMLMSDALPPERRDRALESIERNAKALARLVEDLLDISRVVTGKLRLDLGEVDLLAVVEAALEVVASAATAKGIELRTSLDRTVPTIVGDASRLQQVVWNLLANAVKFTAPGGTVHCSLERDDGTCRITIEDTGVGIAPDFLPSLFERFRQADMGLTRPHSGLGLGLSIVRQIVELHGGVVRVSSEGVGRGATFTVQLPIRASRAAAATSATQPAPQSTPQPPQAPALEARRTDSLRGLAILVVDDDADSRELLSVLLGRRGARVTTAASAGEAMAFVRAARFDVLVSDISMPSQDGYELLACIRALPPEEGGRTPAIAITAHTRANDQRRALLAGFDGHLGKPVDASELVARVASLATRPAAEPPP